MFGGRYEQKKKYAEIFSTFVLYCIDFANNIWLSNTFVIVSECGLCVSLLDCLKKINNLYLLSGVFRGNLIKSLHDESLSQFKLQVNQTQCGFPPYFNSFIRTVFICNFH